MTLKSLDQFDKEIAAKRARLEKEIALAHALPTVGKTVTWIGENGWEKDGNTRKPDVEHTIDLAPYIIHSPFRGAEHVAFRAPDSLAGDKGEHVSSKHRPDFVRRYLLALLDACEPHMIDTVAIQGRYCSNVPETFDWMADKDYKDACEVSRGLFELETYYHAGPHRGCSGAKLLWYIRTDATGPCKISFDLHGGFGTYKAFPRPCMTSDHPNAGPAFWTFPKPSDIGAVHLWRRASGEDCYSGGSRVPWGYTCQWLYATRDKLETFLNLREPRT